MCNTLIFFCQVGVGEAFGLRERDREKRDEKRCQDKKKRLRLDPLVRRRHAPLRHLPRPRLESVAVFRRDE